MRVLRIGLALAVAMTAVACEKDSGPFLPSHPPLAYTRFVNAVPDTFHLDYRFIDQLEYSPTAILLPFRGFTPYQGTETGTRQIRVFPNPGGEVPDINIVSQILLDESITLTAGSYYTIAAVGFARGGAPALQLMVIEDPIPGDPGGNVSVRTVHLGAGMGPVDVYSTAATGDPLPGTPTFTGVGFGSQSAYVTRAPGVLAFQVTDAGAAAVLAEAAAPNGVPGDPDNLLTTIGGVQQPGSVLTAFVFGPSSAGKVGGATFANPGIVYVVDRHPR